MNCATHTETPAVAYCRTCGKALCNECRHELQGVIYCPTCLPQQAAAGPAVAPRPPVPVLQPGAPSPGLAFALGLIPGVGAIYNGQYAKGILHIAIFGLLISINDSHAAGQLEPLLVALTVGWYFYMPFEAYHTARKRAMGEPVDEFSGLLRSSRKAGGVPMGPLALIALGMVFLLHTLGYWSLERILRYWPVLLIVLGIYLLYMRVADRSNGPPAASGHDTEFRG